MRRKQNKKTHFVFNLNLFKFLSVVLFVLILFLTPYLLKTTIKIQKIECSSQFGNCPEDLTQFLNSFTDYNFYVVKKNISKYLDDNFLVENYLLQYKIPNSLKIDLNIKKPKYSFFVPSLSKYFFVTSDGIVVEIKDNTNLPNLNVFSDKGNREYTFGEKIDSDMLFAFDILNNLNYLYSIKEINFEDTKLVAKTNENITLVIPKLGEVDLIVGSIRIIFSRLNDESQGIKMSEVKEIDLRYKNPFIRKW
jgi:hypothetical protein